MNTQVFYSFKYGLNGHWRSQKATFMFILCSLTFLWTTFCPCFKFYINKTFIIRLNTKLIELNMPLLYEILIVLSPFFAHSPGEKWEIKKRKDKRWQIRYHQTTHIFYNSKTWIFSFRVKLFKLTCLLNIESWTFWHFSIQ